MKTQETWNGESRTMRLNFESWFDFVEFGKNRKAQSTILESRNDGPGKKDWTGTYNFDEAVNLAENGWPDGSEKINALTNLFLNKITTLIERPQVEYDVTGNDFDVALVNEGVPECWLKITNEEVQAGNGTKVLRLVYNMSTSAGVTTDVMMSKGATVCALLEALEYAGFRVQLELFEATTYGSYLDNGKHHMYMHIPVKEANQPVDRDKIAFAIAHPSTLRRLVFAADESDKHFMDKAGHSYGTPCEAPTEDQGDIYIGKSLLGEPQWESTKEAVAWVLKQLQAQNVQLTSDKVPA